MCLQTDMDLSNLTDMPFQFHMYHGKEQLLMQQLDIHISDYGSRPEYNQPTCMYGTLHDTFCLISHHGSI